MTANHAKLEKLNNDFARVEKLLDRAKADLEALIPENETAPPVKRSGPALLFGLFSRHSPHGN